MKNNEHLTSELFIANKELVFQIEEKLKCAEELAIANKELVFQNNEKEKQAAELVICNEEMVFQNEEILKQAAELKVANKELAFLNHKQQIFASIVNSSDDAMLTKDLDGIITSWNLGAEKIFGYKEYEIIGKHISILIPPQLQSEEAEIMGKIKNGEKVGHYETERVRKDGSVFNASLTISSIRDFEGNIEGGSKILRDITERKKSEAEIINTTEQLRELTSHLQNIRKEERKRIAREIHDELGQQLAAIKMDTVWIDKQTPVGSVIVKDKLQNILELVDGSHRSVRKILNELRPAVLDDNSLLEAMDWLGQQFTEYTGKAVYFTTTPGGFKLDPEAATCIFRVYQEALSNIMRHAEAQSVRSSLKLSSNSIILAMEDDGKGFDIDIAEGKKRFGLLGMKERVYALQGKFDLASAPGKGTKIVISLPYKNISPQENEDVSKAETNNYKEEKA